MHKITYKTHILLQDLVEKRFDRNEKENVKTVVKHE